MKKNSFTLVELIAVIVLIGIVGLIVFPIITNSLNNSKKRAYQEQVRQIINAAQRYGIENSEILPEQDGLFTKNVSLEKLIKSGYLTKTENGNVYNPIDNKEMKGCVIIKYLVDYSQYEYIYDETCSPQSILEYKNYYVNYGGKYNDSFTHGIATNDGNYLAAGNSNSQIINEMKNYNSTQISNDTIIVKYDPSGKIIWEKIFGGSLTDYVDSLTEVEENGKKYYVVSIWSNSIDYDMNGTNEGYKSVILKYDSDGNLLSKKIFTNQLSRITKVIKTVDGYIAVGWWRNSNGEIYEKRLREPQGLSDEALIMKLDNNFNVQWSNMFGGSTGDYFNDIIETSDKYIVVGMTNSIDGDLTGLSKDNDPWTTDGLIISFDKNGNIINKSIFGNKGNDHLYTITAVSDGFIVGGSSAQANIDLSSINKKGAVLIKLDNNLNIISKQVIENFENNAINKVITDDDNIIATAKLYNNKGYADGAIVKLDNNLNIINTIKLDGGNSDKYEDIAKTTFGYIVFGSTFSKGTSVNSIIDPYSKGNQDAVIVKYDNNLNLHKIFNKKIDLLNIPKEIVKNYGTVIPTYQNPITLYTTNDPSVDLKNWCTSTEIIYGSKDNYKYTYCLQPFNSDDMIKMYEDTNNTGVAFIAGINDYKMNKNLNKIDLSNSWFRLYFFYSSDISQIKLIFNGIRYTLEECVNLGYIEPLVLHGYNASNSIYTVDDTTPVLNGGTLNTNKNSRMYTYFKTKRSGFEGISLNSVIGFNNNLGFSLYAMRDFDISLSKSE